MRQGTKFAWRFISKDVLQTLLQIPHMFLALQNDIVHYGPSLKKIGNQSIVFYSFSFKFTQFADSYSKVWGNLKDSNP